MKSIDYSINVLYYDEAILQREIAIVQNPCTQEISYTLPAANCSKE